MYYPPRPESKIPVDSLPRHERKGWIAQAKLNGMYVVLDKDAKAYNRHKEETKFHIPKPELIRFAGYTVCGEYLTKAQPDETGSVPTYWAVHDVIESPEGLMIGKKYSERYELLRFLCGSPEGTGYVLPVSDNVKLIRSYPDNFCQHFNELAAIPLIEGLVIKNLSQPLRYPFSCNSNSSGMVKVRKPGPTYSF